VLVTVKWLCMSDLCIKSVGILFSNSNDDQVKEDEIGRACSTNGGDEECI
jgi:hypothetical protein